MKKTMVINQTLPMNQMMMKCQMNSMDGIIVLKYKDHLQGHHQYNNKINENSLIIFNINSFQLFYMQLNKNLTFNKN